ncbi:MAG TPA: RDD family protein [Candidatus Eisenbacteria bacterium]|nr:RDD family protein [Candidatus Eisenbacteria bacterium]
MMEQHVSHYESGNAAAEPAPDPWRHEVQDRLARYKRRRGRRIEGAFTMRFPFPADEVVEPAAAVDIAASISEPSDIFDEEVPQPEMSMAVPPMEMEMEAVAPAPPSEMAGEQVDDKPCAEELVLGAPPAPEPEPETFVDTVVRPRPKRKVIAFPKHLSVAPPQMVNRLADPVTPEVPRILDVPEELEAIPTTPFLEGLQLEPANVAAEVRDREHVELPFLAVRTPQRLLAGVVDMTVVVVGVAVFACVAYKILNQPPLTKPLMLAVAAAVVVLWNAYQYLFVVHAGKTIGMMATRIRLRTFQGKSPTVRQRRNRVLGFYLSALSLGMGLMWALVDVDALCWHDRLSRTYLSERE